MAAGRSSTDRQARDPGGHQQGRLGRQEHGVLRQTPLPDRLPVLRRRRARDGSAANALAQGHRRRRQGRCRGARARRLGHGRHPPHRRRLRGQPRRPTPHARGRGDEHRRRDAVGPVSQLRFVRGLCPRSADVEAPALQDARLRQSLVLSLQRVGPGHLRRRHRRFAALGHAPLGRPVRRPQGSQCRVRH